MSSSSRLIVPAVIRSQTWSLVRLRRLRGIRIRWCQVGERARCRPCRLIDAVPDSGPIPSVDQEREDCVHYIVVEGSAPAGLVWATRAGGELDLKKGALLRIWLREVQDEEVSEHELRQRVGAGFVRWPVLMTVEAVPEGKVGVQARAVRPAVCLRQVKRVLHVVQVTNFEVPIHPVELLRPQHEVLHLRPPDT